MGNASLFRPGSVVRSASLRQSRFALDRQSLLFLDGVKVATHNIGSATLYAVASSKLLEVGRDSAGPGEYIDAYIDELRVTKGVCRHSTDYTPPPNPFPETA